MILMAVLLAQTFNMDRGICFRLISGDGVEVTTWVHVEKIDSVRFRYVYGVHNHPEATQALFDFGLIMPEADTIQNPLFTRLPFDEGVVSRILCQVPGAEHRLEFLLGLDETP